VLVTGGAGFVGARIVRAALAAGADVIVLERAGASVDRIADLAAVRVVHDDILDEAGVTARLAEERPHIVVHAAGYPDSRREPTLATTMMRVHACGTTNVLEASRLAGVERVVALGSAGEYGDASEALSEEQAARPLDPYSVSKLAATESALAYDRAFGLACTVVRPFIVYGPGEPRTRLLPSVFVRALAGGGEVAFTPGEQVRDFVYVDDVAEGTLRAAVSPAARGLVLNLGTGLGVRVRDAVTQAITASGSHVVADFGGLPYRPGETLRMVADTSRVERVLGWKPETSLEAGVALAYASFAGEPARR